jgi:hypothetical protein
MMKRRLKLRSTDSVKIFRVALVCAVGVLMPLAAHAVVTVRDVQIAVRVLNFIANPPNGTVKIGIVYDPHIPGSVADEQELLDILGTGLTIDGVTLVPVPLTIDQLASTPVDLLFLTSDMTANGARVRAAATAKKILCITTDFMETEAGNCALSVQTTPKVRIMLNKATAAASRVSFEAAFLLMITEI